MPLMATRLQRMWSHFKLSVPSWSEDRVYLSRWKQCVSLTSDEFGPVVGHMYVNQMAADWTNSWVSVQINSIL